MDDLRKKELIEKEEEFQVYLKDDDYTVIAPTEYSVLIKFIELVGRMKPKENYKSSIHDALSDKKTIWKVIVNFPEDTFDVFVVFRIDNQIPVFSTIEEYCKEYKIILK